MAYKALWELAPACLSYSVTLPPLLSPASPCTLSSKIIILLIFPHHSAFVHNVPSARNALTTPFYLSLNFLPSVLGLGRTFGKLSLTSLKIKWFLWTLPYYIKIICLCFLSVGLAHGIFLVNICRIEMSSISLLDFY